MTTTQTITLETAHGKYEINAQPIGGGGNFSYLYKGRQTRTKRGIELPLEVEVALKIPNPHKEAQCDVILDNEIKVYQHFKEEGEHPRLPHYVESGKSAQLDRKYLLLTWLTGESLADRLGVEEEKIAKKDARGEVIKDAAGKEQEIWHVTAQRAFSEEVAVRYYIELLQTLQYVHSKGVVNADVSPGNTMIAERGEIKLIDFGIARKIGTGFKIMYNECVVGEDAAPHTPATTKKASQYGYGFDETIYNKIYSPPEILETRGGNTDPHIDLYMATNLLHLMLFKGICNQDCSQEHPVKQAFLKAVLEKGLHKTLAERYQSADDIFAVPELREYAWNMGMPYINGAIDVEKFRVLRYHVDTPQDEQKSLGRIKEVSAKVSDPTKNELRDYVQYQLKKIDEQSEADQPAQGTVMSLQASKEHATRQEGYLKRKMYIENVQKCIS